MTRAQWLRDLARRGCRVFIAGTPAQLRVRGSLSARDRRRLEADRRELVRLLRRRRARRAQQREAEPIEQQQGRVVVGQTVLTSGGGPVRGVAALYEDETREIPARREGAHGWNGFGYGDW